MQLTENLYRVDGLRGANVYVARTDGGLLVVDTGMPGSAEKIAAFIRGLGQKPTDVHTIAITHTDPDHIGSVAELKRLTGARVSVHAADAETLAGASGGKQLGPVARFVFSLLAPFIRIEPVDPDDVVDDGDTLAGFSVMHVPGHTPGSIALHRDGVVFSGDALLSDAKGNERPPRKALSDDYEQALRSAEKIRALGYDLLLTGHGAPVFADRR